MSLVSSHFHLLITFCVFITIVFFSSYHTRQAIPYEKTMTTKKTTKHIKIIVSSFIFWFQFYETWVLSAMKDRNVSPVCTKKVDRYLLQHLTTAIDKKRAIAIKVIALSSSLQFKKGTHMMSTDNNTQG